MNEQELQHIAAQLRQPHGEMGTEVAERMNVNNEQVNRWAIERLAVQPNGCAAGAVATGQHFAVALLRPFWL